MRLSVFCLASVLLFITHPVRAGSDAPARTNDAAIKTSASTPEIVVDKAKGVIRFMVDGKEVATITKDGLTVKWDVSYTGTLKDADTAEGDHAK
jgi:hypothetical protein